MITRKNALLFISVSVILILFLSTGLTSSNMNSYSLSPGYKFVGAEKCASVCHNNDTMGFQLNSWLKSSHAQAFNVLNSKKAVKYARNAGITSNPSESSHCLQCHITGSGLEDSYFTITYKKEDGVTCEACHKHLPDGKTYIPTESDCSKCHNNSLHRMPLFKFKEDCAKIAHPAKMALKNRPAI